MNLRKVTGFAATVVLLAVYGTVSSKATAAPLIAAQAVVATPMAQFNEPWAMTFLPDGRLLVTEKRGQLKVYTVDGSTATITGVPAVSYGGQGGLLDVVLHPAFAANNLVYFSFAEAGANNTRGTAVARARLSLSPQSGGSLSNVQVIWRQSPKVTGPNHFGGRIAFGSDGRLWISSSERNQFEPAQQMNTTLGKILRLNDDGSIPADNPFVSQGGVARQIWSLGHRNVYGLAFDSQGRLWSHEMGPRGGDELNIIERGSNYGWPIVSNGDHYDGRVIPDHHTRPEFNAPEVWWNPVISPAGLIFYDANLFSQWRGNALIGGLSARGLIRVAISGATAREVERINLNQRIREVEQGPDGAIWVLEDQQGSSGGRLLRLTPR
ncbi:PQQ-dependent sugar dehydrogenase [Steroidobacter sp. S1-65]|uniref:PQQ-dependent sugar dehydrogenase n=1 Tax=Steroidobacter gossypii TaxID=2805490 RepID=A0ABS1WV37_9GAMM|nr:PQQ-dependent sugar dehydrogenase [Steroidobacter gossypii]MBM0104839.1 PQQ-dependent sugar dehydrogenase [Steroidobacter gossypii]